MSHWFHLHPFDYERLTFDELREYQRALAAIGREQKKAAKQRR